MLLSRAIDDFLVWLTPRKLSPATLRAYKQDIEMISRCLSGATGKDLDVLSIEDLDRRTLRAAFSSFSTEHAKASILRAHSTWRQFFEYLVSDGVVEGNPMGAVNRPKVDERKPKPIEGWAEDSVTRLLETLASGKRKGRNTWPERDVAVVATLLATGARSSELLSMNVGSVEGDPGQQVIRVIGKGSKPRTIPVEEGLDQILGVYLESRKARFPNWKPKSKDALFVASSASAEQSVSGGQRLNANQLHYLLDTSFRAAGLSNRRPPGAMAHAFRHTFGTSLAADGAPVSAIRKLMGHSSINTSQGYIDSLAREEREVAARNRVYDVLGKLQSG